MIAMVRCTSVIRTDIRMITIRHRSFDHRTNGPFLIKKVGNGIEQSPNEHLPPDHGTCEFKLSLMKQQLNRTEGKLYSTEQQLKHKLLEHNQKFRNYDRAIHQLMRELAHLRNRIRQ